MSDFYRFDHTFDVPYDTSFKVTIDDFAHALSNKQWRDQYLVSSSHAHNGRNMIKLEVGTVLQFERMKSDLFRYLIQTRRLSTTSSDARVGSVMELEYRLHMPLTSETSVWTETTASRGSQQVSRPQTHQHIGGAARTAPRRLSQENIGSRASRPQQQTYDVRPATPPVPPGRGRPHARERQPEDRSTASSSPSRRTGTSFVPTTSPSGGSQKRRRL